MSLLSDWLMSTIEASDEASKRRRALDKTKLIKLLNTYLRMTGLKSQRNIWKTSHSKTSSRKAMTKWRISLNVGIACWLS